VRKATLNQNKKDILLEIFRFLLVGGIATIGDYVVFYLFNIVLLKQINPVVNSAISTTLGFITGLLINWFLSKFVFKNVTDNQMHSKMVFTKYVILSLLGFLLTLIVMTATTPIHDKLVLSVFGLFTFQFWKLFFKVLMTLIVLVLNYLGRKFFVFKKRFE
jgi:putative flippase GtrA